MQARTNNARWNPKRNCWMISVQRDGKRRYFYSSRKGKAGQQECNQKADEWLFNKTSALKKIKVAKLYEDYIREKALYVGTSRLANVRSMFNRWILPAIGRKNVGNITEQDLQDVLNEQYRKGRSYKRIKETKICMCDFMKYARKNNLTTLVPENLTVSTKASQTVRQTLQPSDLQVLFSSDKTFKNGFETVDEWIHAYRFMVVTGLRRGEMLGLKWSDIDYVNKIIHVNRAINEYREVTQGKTGNAIRIIPLTRIAEAILKATPRRCAYVFNKPNMSASPNSVTYGFKRYALYNNLKATKLHELRHTFISLTDNELPLNTLKDIVGHSKSTDTVGIYGHVIQGEISAAGEQIDEIFATLLKA